MGSEPDNQLARKETSVMVIDPLPVLCVTRPVEQELVLLLALYHASDAVSLTHTVQLINRLGYWRGAQPDWHATWNDRCLAYAYVSPTNGGFALSSQGVGRLYDLCTLAYALRDPLKHLTTSGYQDVCRVRKALRKQAERPPFSSRAVSQTVYQEHRSEYHVYVVLLKSDVLSQYPFLLRLNPDRKANYACLYVGHTARTPDLRFESHRRGSKASIRVRDFGVSLVPDLYAHFNPLPSREHADDAERKLALTLRAQGYTTTAGHHDRQE